MRMSGRRTNWAGNVTFTARQVHRPASVAELQRLVAGSERIRALGTGHSFSRIADSPGELVSVAALPDRVEVDAGRSTVTVGAGIRYGELASRLHEQSYALHNLGSLPHISVAGACATGTHGSGDANGNLSTAVAAIELVTADGELVVLRRDADGDRFRAAVVGLGAFGILTALTLDLLPTFHMRQYVYDNLPFGQLTEHVEDVFASAYSVSLFTDWTGPWINQVWRKHRIDEHDGTGPPRRWLGAELADGPRHPVAGMPVRNCTEQLGVPGPWHERLPHFRLEFTPSSGAELQSEFLLPRHQVLPALEAVLSIQDKVAPVLQISEFRTVAADELWLSPSYRRDSVAIHFTWVPDAAAVAPVLAAVEDRLAPFEARPHWGKLFGADPAALRARYERMPDFQRLRHEHDPTGKFGNEMLDRYAPAVPAGTG
jgi:xylitol oxidase